MRNIYTGEIKKPYNKTMAAHAFVSKNHDFLVFDDNSPDYYRGCRWKVGFHNVKTNKMVYIHTLLPAIISKEEIESNQSIADKYQNIHPDPHPQFVCNDKYVVSTAQQSDGCLHLSITPVEQLMELTQ